MKLFARAKIPTEEAGTFTMKRPPAAQSAVAQLHPSNSISQAGVRPTSASSVITNSANSAQKPFPVPADTKVHHGTTNAITSVTDAVEATSYPLEAPNMQGKSQHFIFPKSPELGSAPNWAVSAPSESDSNPNVRPTCLPDNNIRSTSVQQSGPLVSVTPSSINLYVPRPSTAPEMESHRLSQTLPPKRDLPFATSNNPKSCMKKSKETKSSFRDETDNLKSPEITQKPTAPEEPTLSTVTKRKRIPTAKAASKAPATKKPRAAASRKKANKASEPQESTVPSVEELLGGPSAVGIDPTKIVDNENLDTQVLLARAAQQTFAAAGILRNDLDEDQQDGFVVSGGLSTAVTTVDPSKNMSAATTDPLSLDHGTDENPHPSTAKPQFILPQSCAPLSSMLNVLNDSSFVPPGPQLFNIKPTDKTSASIPRTQLIEFPSHPSCCHTLQDSLPNNPPCHPPATTDQAPNKPTPPFNSGTASSSSADRQSPNDVNPNQDEQPTAVPLTSLPRENQQEILESWICHQLQSPKFAELCRVMESSWKVRLILG